MKGSKPPFSFDFVGWWFAAKHGEADMCRYLYRPYGRVDRTKLKTKLLQRCVQHGVQREHLHVPVSPRINIGLSVCLTEASLPACRGYFP